MVTKVPDPRTAISLLFWAGNKTNPLIKQQNFMNSHPARDVTICHKEQWAPCANNTFESGTAIK